MIVCLPVKNGWQFEQTSTRSSSRVDPTVHSVPQDPQWTLASKYLGWMSGFTMCSPPTSSVPGDGPAGDRRLVLVGRQAFAAAVFWRAAGAALAEAVTASTASTRIRFLVLVACS